MVAKLFFASALPGIVSCFQATKHESRHNTTYAGAASMIVAGVTSREEYCLSAAGGEFLCCFASAARDAFSWKKAAVVDLCAARLW